MSRKRWELAHRWVTWLLYTVIFTVEWHQCAFCTQWPWPIFSMPKFGNNNMSETVKARLKMRMKTFIEVLLLGISRGKLRRQRMSPADFQSTLMAPPCRSCLILHCNKNWITQLGRVFLCKPDRVLSCRPSSVNIVPWSSLGYNLAYVMFLHWFYYD